MKDINPPKPAHSKIGASSMYRWAACPGSVRLSEGIVSPESSFAAEGTIAHDHVANLLEQYYFGKVVNITWPDLDMKEAGEVYFDVVKHDAFSCAKRTKDHILIEHKFDLEKIHKGLFGTADCVLYDEINKTLRVYDFKYGAGIPVEVTDNQQLKYYGLGAMLTCGFKPEYIELVVVQPRCLHPDGVTRRQTITALDMLDFSADLKDAVLETEKPDAPLASGEHCRFCPAKINCPELTSKAQSLARQDFNDKEPYIKSELSKALDFVPILKSWIKSVEEFAFYEASQGREAPGYKMVAKRAVRKWKDDESVTELALLNLNGDEDFFEKKLLSPAKVEKLLGKGYKDHLNELVTKESSGYTLVHESDKRPAKALEAAKDFGKVE